MTRPDDDDAESPRAGRMRATPIGLAFGTALGFAGAFGGFVAFLVVLVLAAVGVLAGLVIDGRISISDIVNRDRVSR